MPKKSTRLGTPLAGVGEPVAGPALKLVE
jgi:hypothetical protein